MHDALRIKVFLHGEELLSKTFTRDRILIGRGPKCDLRLNGLEVSRQHALIEKRDPRGYVLRDLESSNGTLVGNEAVTLLFIREGGRVHLGEFELAFQLLDAPWDRGDDPAAATPEASRQETIPMSDHSPSLRD